MGLVFLLNIEPVGTGELKYVHQEINILSVFHMFFVCPVAFSRCILGQWGGEPCPVDSKHDQ